MEVLYTHLPYHNDSIIETDARRKTHEGRRMNEDAVTKMQEEMKQEDFFNNIFLPLSLLQGSKGLFKVCMWEGAWDQT